MPGIPHTARSRGFLPHWESDHATYFVTFRLADSLPGDLLERLGKEEETLERVDRGMPAGSRRYEVRAILQKAEQALDSGLGACYLSDRRIAKIVADAIRHFHGERYCLWAWCIMPNHVHVLFSPLGEQTLDSIVHSWKSFSGLQANRLLGRTGQFWQREYFDHLVRNEASLLKISRYVLENPCKAGLVDWPWVEILV